MKLVVCSKVQELDYEGGLISAAVFVSPNRRKTIYISVWFLQSHTRAHAQRCTQARA